jgi:glycosyltransferase involved in cell wall biosynthesis
MIFVNMACYRDPECQPTLLDLFRKARFPDRVNVGLVLQTMPSDGIAVSRPRVQVRHVPANQARGPCWARALGYRMLRNETHVLQIDSHMRFAPDWDVRMLAQLAACPAAKPLLTTYPPGYEPPDELLTHEPTFLTAQHFDDSGMLVQHGLVGPKPAAPKRTACVAAGFLFGSADWVRQVPYDPGLYFHGEEATLALRLWTHGWDFFGPAEPLIWHRYTQAVRPLHWEDDPDWHHLDNTSRARVRQVLGMPPRPGDARHEIGHHGIGLIRSRARFRRFSGIDYRTLTVAPHATRGDFDDVPQDRLHPPVAFRLGSSRLLHAAWPVYA